MSFKLFKIMFYFILILLILFFYLKDINLFSKFYKNIKIVKNPNNLDVLVNKNNKLNKNYIPNDLVLMDLEYSNEGKYLRKEAYDSFVKLHNDSKKLGFNIVITSAFRSYDYQKELYNSYVVSSGKSYADRCSARSGHSEHQTGLAIDVMGSNNDYNLFSDSIEFDWMKNNSYKYGFILRYPNGKEHITGFKYEPWHYRYVGTKLATYLYKNNLTLEEYKNM